MVWRKLWQAAARVGVQGGRLRSSRMRAADADIRVNNARLPWFHSSNGAPAPVNASADPMVLGDAILYLSLLHVEMNAMARYTSGVLISKTLHVHQILVTTESHTCYDIAKLPLYIQTYEIHFWGYTGDWGHRTSEKQANAFLSIQPFPPPSQGSLTHSLHHRNESNKHTNLPARTDTRRSARKPSRRLLILAERRLQLQAAGHIARLAEVGVRVDLVGDAGCPVGQVFGLRLAPMVAAGVVFLDGAFAAVGAHFLDEGVVGDGDGAHEVGFGLVDIAEAGDEGRRADGVGHAADWRGEG